MLPPRERYRWDRQGEGLGRLHPRFGKERADPSRARGGGTRAGEPTLITGRARQPSGTPKRTEPSKIRRPREVGARSPPDAARGPPPHPFMIIISHHHHHISIVIII